MVKHKVVEPVSKVGATLHQPWLDNLAVMHEKAVKLLNLLQHLTCEANITQQYTAVIYSCTSSTQSDSEIIPS